MQARFNWETIAEALTETETETWSGTSIETAWCVC